MGAADSTELSLNELVVLGLIAEGRTHGWALARLLAPDGELGAIWTVRRALVYRSVAQLAEAGLVREVGEAPGDQGPNRTLVAVTARGRKVMSAWLDAPVRHVRDLRSELLVKLALLDRAGLDPGPLLHRQRAALAPVAANLRRQLAEADGFDAVLARWRVETTDAALRFLDASAQPGGGRKRRAARTSRPEEEVT